MPFQAANSRSRFVSAVPHDLLEYLIITTAGGYHLLRLVQTDFDSRLVLYVWLDRIHGNLAVARRHSPVLVALYTTRGNVSGSRMSRSLKAFADRVKDRAIVALGNLDEEPDLAKRAGVDYLPAWVVYSDGVEVSRATGDNADLSVDRLLNAQTVSSH